MSVLVEKVQSEASEASTDLESQVRRETAAPPSTLHFKARLENKHQLTGNSVIITVMKTTQDFSIMEKRQALMSSEPSRMLLNISNTKNERLYVF